MAPDLGLHNKVVKQTNHFRTKPEFKCPDHGIFISPSTSEYDCECRNVLWKDDHNLLTDVKKVKRESRMARERSEDALSWNVFRYLENKTIGYRGGKLKKALNL